VARHRMEKIEASAGQFHHSHVRNFSQKSFDRLINSVYGIH
jgi:hypothetical protein